jgi:hypothetical protein
MYDNWYHFSVTHGGFITMRYYRFWLIQFVKSSIDSKFNSAIANLSICPKIQLSDLSRATADIVMWLPTAV